MTSPTPPPLAPRPPAISRRDGPTADEAPQDPEQSCQILPDASDQQTRQPIAPPPPAKPFIYSGWTASDKPSPLPAEPTPSPRTATIPVQPAVTETAGDIPPRQDIEVEDRLCQSPSRPQAARCSGQDCQEGSFPPRHVRRARIPRVPREASN